LFNCLIVNTQIRKILEGNHLRNGEDGLRTCFSKKQQFNKATIKQFSNSAIKI
jgi:hypothetical protein